MNLCSLCEIYRAHGTGDNKSEGGQKVFHAVKYPAFTGDVPAALRWGQLPNKWPALGCASWTGCAHGGTARPGRSRPHDTSGSQIRRHLLYHSPAHRAVSRKAGARRDSRLKPAPYRSLDDSLVGALRTLTVSARRLAELLLCCFYVGYGTPDRAPPRWIRDRIEARIERQPGCPGMEITFSCILSVTSR